MRKRSGLSFQYCKKALDKFGGDLDAAHKWLNEEAVRAGLEKASRAQDRATPNGLVGLVTRQSGNGHTALALAELNCETDFVAKNESFVKAISEVTTSVLLNGIKRDVQPAASQPIGRLSFTPDEAKSLPAATGTQDLNTLIASVIQSVGERVVLRRALFLNVPPPLRIQSFVHHELGAALSSGTDCQLGKYAVALVYEAGAQTEAEAAAQGKPHAIYAKLRSSTQAASRKKHAGEMSPEEAAGADEPSVQIDTREALLHCLCQHVVGLRPARVGSPNTDKPVAIRLREQKKKLKAGQVVPPEERLAPDAPEPLLIYQPLLHDERSFVGEFVDRFGLRLVEFIRFEAGEQI